MFTATLLAVGSAFIHAGWNLLIKTSDDRRIAAWGQFAAGGLLALPALAFVGLPGWKVVPFLACTACVHVLYVEGLTGAYRNGDFSLTYPLARGGGAVVAALGGVALLGDSLTALAWASLGVVALGLISLKGRGRSTGMSWAVFTAACIGTYTLIDAHGARTAAAGVSYALATMPATALVLSAVHLAKRRGPALAATVRTDWWRYLVGGVGATVAYTMVLVAVRFAPVGYVTMLRESSVVIGAFAGWLVLKEGLGARRVASSAVILSGLVLLVAAGV